MFTVKRIGEIVRQLEGLRFPLSQRLGGWKMQVRSGETRPSCTDLGGCWEEIPEAGVWGGHMEYRVFSGKIVIPEAFSGKHVLFRLLTGKEGEWDGTNPQFTVYVNGTLRQGFDVNHTSLCLSESAVPGTEYDIFLSAFTGTQNFHLLFNASLQSLDAETEGLYYDLKLPWQAMELLDEQEPAYLELEAVLTEAVNALDLRKPYSAAYYRSVARAREILKEKIYTVPRDSFATVRLIGHTHIDVAWLWTLAVTRDKAVRSFSTVLELMKKYPEYRFMSSQPQLYKFVKEAAPEVYEGIRQRVAEGRWEPEGGMFLEADCNLISGESFVRQFLYGKRFFRQEFGRDNQILWLPDVFGYSAALPQIMKKSGIRYFMTTKISWNEVNKLPYDSFYWKGIDGTKILTHFSPTRDYVQPKNLGGADTIYTTYTGDISPRQMKGAWQRYQQKNLNRDVLTCFGHGDGGGGPTAEMLEAQRRMTYGIPGCPRTQPDSALDFFRRLEADLQGKPVPTWTGELYLEYHRGTYTSMARNKKWNRRGEFALTNVESEAVLAGLLAGVPYPALQEYWEILLRNQFHDILPGSSIREVYEDSKKEYEKLFAYIDDTQARLLQTVADGVGGTIVWNPNGQELSGLAVLEQDASNVWQKTADGKYLAWAESVPAKGYTLLENRMPELEPVSISPRQVITPFAEIQFNEQGHITSWYDRQACRQLLQPGTCGNVLMTYEDKPFQYDNWNLQDYYKEKAWPVEDLVSGAVIETGPLRYALKLVWNYQDSQIEEILYFYPNTPRVDVHFSTDWNEDQVLLKALFPVEINTAEATFEIQYGNVKRPTTVNTSWDAARFEVCYHKWMDVSEGGYGVSFLNDCKFGVSIEENVVGLSLLKSGRDPNPMADREHHEAVYSVFPHIGSWQEAGTVREGYLLNNPLRTCTGRSNAPVLPARYSLVSHDHRNIMVEAVKQAEDSTDLIIRLYEFENTRTEAKLHLAQPFRKVWLCDLMEEKETLLAENSADITVPVEPFGIITICAER